MTLAQKYIQGKHKRRRSRLSLKRFSICILNLAARRGFLAAKLYYDHTESGCRGGGGGGGGWGVPGNEETTKVCPCII